MYRPEYRELFDVVAKAAQAVFAELGADHLEETVYETALEIELKAAGLAYRRQPEVAVLYRGVFVERLRPDFILEIHDIDREAGTFDVYPAILEVKRLKADLGRPEFAQVRRYMRTVGTPAACLINFPAYKSDVEIEQTYPGLPYSKIAEVK